MQFREEAIAAANRAIDDVISSPFIDHAARPELIDVDIDNDGDTDYVVQIDTPVCISATEAFGADPSSLSLPPAMTVASTWNTVWDIRATVAADETVDGEWSAMPAARRSWCARASACC